MSGRMFTKRPVEVEAVLWDGTNVDDVLVFIYSDTRWKEGLDDGGDVHGPGIGHTVPLGTLDIPTLEGVMTAQPGDWIIRGGAGEIYPCKPGIFRSAYETDDGDWCIGCGALVIYETDDFAPDQDGGVLCVACLGEEVSG